MTSPPPRRLAALLLLGAGLAVQASGGPTVAVWVEVWVELIDEAAAPSGGAASSPAAGRTERVRAQQDALAVQLASLGAVELARVQHVGNAIAVRIDADQLVKLEALPGVKRVRPVRTLHPPRPMP